METPIQNIDDDKKYFYSERDGRMVNLLKFLRINVSFFVVLLICVLIISLKTDTNVAIGFITIFLLQAWSYFSHMLGHNDILFINWHLLHHNPDVSKKPLYMFIEFCINFMFSGGFLLIFWVLFFKQFLNVDVGINCYIVFFWSIVYSTYHLLNYHYLDVESHHNHHKNTSKNFAPDWMDILFLTKTNDEKMENMNSSVINMVFATCLVLFLKDTAFDPVAFISNLMGKFVPQIKIM
jgi:hypothetical protein